MRIVVGAIILLATACGSSNGGGPGGGGGDDVGATGARLTISPAAIDVLSTNGARAHATFTATLTYVDGTTQDVTGTTRFDVDPRFGAFDHNGLELAVAGRTQVFATYSDAAVNATASADVISRVRVVRVAAPLPDTTPSRFPDNAPVVGAPTLVYPHDDSQASAPSIVMPRNLGDFELHWRDAADDTFELSLSTDDGAGGTLSDVRVYVPGGNAGGDAGWAQLKPSEWQAAVGVGSSVTYRLRGAAAATPGTVSATPAYTVPLSETDMVGTMYLFAAKPDFGADGLYRHDMGSEPGTAATALVTTAQTGGRCVGCHAVSRDGTAMAMTYWDTNATPGPGTTVDLKTGQISAQTQPWIYATFTPDNAQLLTVNRGVLVVRNAQTQAVITQMDTSATWVTQPDLSPDGTKLVYVRPTLPNNDYNFRGGEIYVRTYDATTHRFGPEQRLITGGNNFDPAWSPDGNWIAFAKNADTRASDSSYDDPITQVWVMKADGSQAQVLASANVTARTSTSPRWAPIATTRDATHEPMLWLSFTSKREFGVRMSNAGLSQGASRAQLWMVPFFPQRVGQDGADPSATAFRLPFQNVAVSNQTAQWSKP